MRKEFAYLAALAIAGCASAPEPDPLYDQTANVAQLAAAQGASDIPVTLPQEATLQEPHTIDFFVRMALERNPEIIAAKRRVLAQEETITQATSLKDPMLMDTFWPSNDNSPQTAAGRSPNMLSLSQQFPWRGKLRIRGEVAEQQAKMTQTELAAAQLKIIEGVKLSYYDLWFNQQAISITEASGSLLTDLLKLADAKKRVGGSQQDVLRAQLEIDRLKNELIKLRRELGFSQADLAKLLHTSLNATPIAAKPDESVSVPDQIDRLYEAAVRCRPELQKQLHAIIRDRRFAELARLDYYPDVTTAISWQAITGDNALSPMSNGNDNLGFGIGVNLPIWHDKLEAKVREAEHRTVSSARMYDSSRDDTFRMIKRLMVQSRALDEQIGLFRHSIISGAEETLRVSVADYRGGKVDFQQIIDNWISLLRFKIQLARIETSLSQTLASLERVVGCELTAIREPAADGVELHSLVLPTSHLSSKSKAQSLEKGWHSTSRDTARASDQ